MRGHEVAMERALELARAAAARDEVPVGAVVTGPGGRLLAGEHNRREELRDPTAHAEVLALRAAAARIDSWRLEGCSLYVTLEPCAMCAGAAVLARIATLVYGASDPKAGMCGSLADLVRDERLNHRIEVVSGVSAEACGRILTDFFRARR